MRGLPEVTLRRTERAFGSPRDQRRPQQTLLPRPSVTGTQTTLARTPTANRPPVLLSALLHVRPDELLGVLLEHLVDLVEDGVHVIGELFVPLGNLRGGARLGLFGLFGPAGGLLLTACVLVRCHVTTSVVPTLSSPVGVLPNPAGPKSVRTRDPRRCGHGGQL